MFRQVTSNPFSVAWRFSRLVQPGYASFSTHVHSPAIPCLLGPGMHLASSPVVGARSKEFSRLSFFTKRHPALKELEHRLCDMRYRLIIPAHQKDKADSHARELFLDYIKKYNRAGMTADNIVQWVDPATNPYPAPNYCQTRLTPTANYVAITVATDNGIEKGYYTPPYLIAYHEVMHAEEIKKNLYHYRYGRETMATLKSILLLDEINKKIRRVDVGTEIDYHKSVRLTNRAIPLGTFANFYRALEKRHRNLGEAVTSEVSLEFLSADLRGFI